MDELPKDPLGMIMAGVVSVAGALLWLRTKLSKDSAVIANGRAEVDMIERLSVENKDLRENLIAVSAERNQLYRDIGEMTGMLRALEASQKLMEQHIAQLKEEIASLQQTVERSSHERAS